MKRFLLFVFAIVAFAACEQAPIEEQSAIRYEAPDTITVGFEGDDTRVQLNKAQKTVWNNGDEVSVFYRSNGNQKWQYKGEDGVRQANLSRVQDATGNTAITKTIVVYPYNETYWLNTDSYCIEATTPATQHYTVDSYGVGDNLMVSQGEFTQISLKNVYGWLKLQLTGDGETIKSIKFRGNDGEQVAGLIYVDTATAEATLAAEMGDADDNNAGSNLVFEDTILTEVTLDCGMGVTLGAEATSFYIALPPQTFDDGFTVEVACVDGSKMVKSSNKALSIERNHIQPMAEFSYTANISPSNQIWYTSSNGKVVTPYDTKIFGANITSNKYNNGMGIITFDGDVTTIGNSAFNGCSSLTSVNIPDSVTEIGEDAFYKCTSLTSVTIGDSVTTIGEWAFRGCTSLTEFTGKFAEDNGRILVVDGVLTAFAPAGITEYNIPDSVTEIGNSAFASCTSLTRVNIPDSVTEIGEDAFYYCTSLTSVNIPDSVTSIGEWAFGYCGSLTNVNIPDSVTTIGERAFQNCTSLTSVTIPDSVTTIGNDAFYNCTSLTSVYCYATVPPSLGSSAFSSNASGRRIYVYEECVELYKSAWSSYKNSIYTNGQNCPETTTIQYTTNDGNTITSSKLPIISNIYDNGAGTLVVVGKIALIPNEAFRYSESLTSVNIPDSVTSIGNSAFKGCYSLTSVNIPDSVTSIGEWAFGYCSSLTSVNIPDSVTTIGESAFCACTSLTSVNIPDSVTTIGSQTFRDCGSLTSVTIGDSVTTIGNTAFYQCTSLTSVNIPDSVTSIGTDAFFYCTSLTSVNIGNSVTEIGVRAFADCDSLTNVNIPDSVTSIGQYAFESCGSLTSVTISDSVTSIGYAAFFECTSLTSVTIGDSVTTIGSSAFERCTILKEFKGKYATEDGRSLIVDNTIIAYANASGTTYTIPDSVTTIGNYAFKGCDSLTSVNIPDSVTEIGNGAFGWCTSLTSVNIPDSVTTIGVQAFCGCDSLTNVNIPDSVTKIGNEAFHSCDNLTSVYCKATTPPALGGTYVFDYNGSGRKIYVPAGSVNAYKSAEYWSEYKSAIVGYEFENGEVVE